MENVNVSDEEKLKMINETFGTDISLDGLEKEKTLEDKIIENTQEQISKKHFIHVYSSIAFLDIDALYDYIIDNFTNKYYDIELSEVSTIPRNIDDVYIVSSDEKISEIAKEWIEHTYPDKKVYIAEDENGVPDPSIEIPKPEPVVQYKKKPKLSNIPDYTFNSYIVIASLDTGDEKTETTEAQAKAIEFFTTHKVILADTFEEGKKLPNNIAIVIGNPSKEYNRIVYDLKKINYSTTDLLLNIKVKTHHPDLFKDLQFYLNDYVEMRYGSLGIEAIIDIIDSPEDADHPENVYFELDMESNIPTTTIHNDILAFVGSYCLNIEFEHNRKN